MTPIQLSRLLRWLILAIALILLCFGLGYRLEMDTRSGQMRRIETLLGMRVWRGVATESFFSEAMPSGDQGEPNWIEVAERRAMQEEELSMAWQAAGAGKRRR